MAQANAWDRILAHMVSVGLRAANYKLLHCMPLPSVDMYKVVSSHAMRLVAVFVALLQWCCKINKLPWIGAGSVEHEE